MEGLGKPRHGREGRRLSERDVSESNLGCLRFVSPEMSPAFARSYGLAGDFARHDNSAGTTIER